MGGSDYDINVTLALDEEDGSSSASRSMPPPPDTIIASDVVYDPTVVASLVNTIVTLLNVPVTDVDDESRRRQRVAYLAAEERNPTTWTVFKNEVQNRNLIIVDRSNEARVALQMQNTFWVSNETQDRVHVLELKLPS